MKRKRITQWIEAIRRASGAGAHIPWLGMVRAFLSGPVPRRVWFHRLSVCRKCPVFNRSGWICRSPLHGYENTGCGCFIPFSALSAAPYPQGCWIAEASENQAGWPAYVFPSRWAKLRAVLRFAFKLRDE